MPFTTTWMDLEGIMLSELNQTEKYKHCMISLTCGIKNKQMTQTSAKTKLTDTENRLVVARGGGGGVGKVGEGVKRYNLQL